MVETSPIILATEPQFVLGNMTVTPSLRQLQAMDGSTEIIEPRVMQVLVALAKAHGVILPRDELTRTCWDGRIVGEDAINRVISRLRHLATGIGANSFRIETINKVGYRLVAGDQNESGAMASDHGFARPVSRRAAVVAGGTALALAVAGGLALRQRSRKADDAADFVGPATIALLTYDTPSLAQAIGMLRRAVATDPASATSWGLLAIAYAFAAQRGRPLTEEQARREAQVAIDRARALQSGQPEAEHAEMVLLPTRGNWATKEARYRLATGRHPSSPFLRMGYGDVLGAIGRVRGAAEQFASAVRLAPSAPGPYVASALAQWSSGSTAAADRTIEQGMDLFPLHYLIWFTRFNILMYSGRAEQAVRFAEDIEHRPTMISPEVIAHPLDAARALATASRPEIDAAEARYKSVADSGAGDAEDAMLFAAFAGHRDDAFAIANAYFFGRGFTVPDAAYPLQTQRSVSLASRETHYLFMPPTRSMRQDPRFASLTEALGLNKFWKLTGLTPDYLSPV